MRRMTSLHWPAAALALSLFAAPTNVTAQQDNKTPTAATTPCTQFIAPLERRLKEVGPRLERVTNVKTRQAERSRLLFDILSNEDTQKAIALTLGCLTTERR